MDHEGVEPHMVISEVIEDLAQAEGRMRSPTVFRWADKEHIPGCDLAFAPGEVCRFGPWLTKPHGRLHFAGTERSS